MLIRWHTHTHILPIDHYLLKGTMLSGVGVGVVLIPIFSFNGVVSVRFYELLSHVRARPPADMTPPSHPNTPYRQTFDRFRVANKTNKKKITSLRRRSKHIIIFILLLSITIVIPTVIIIIVSIDSANAYCPEPGDDFR